MDTVFLKEFIVFSKYLSYSRAAKELYISQQTLRSHIRILESIIGGPLVFKHGESLSLTSSGRHLLKEARTIVNLTDLAIKECERLVSESTSINIGFLDSQFLEDIFVDARNEFLRENPQCSLELLFNYQMTANLESIDNGTNDISVMPLVRNPRKKDEVNFPELPDGIEALYIKTCKCLFWITDRCNLYDKEVIRTRDANELSLVLGNTSNMIDAGAKYKEYFELSGSTIHVDNQPFLSFMDYYLVSEPDCFGSILDLQRYAYNPQSGCRIFEFEDLDVFADLYLIYEKNPKSNTTADFVNVIKKYIG